MRFRLTSLIVALLLTGVVLGLNVTEDYRYGNFAPPGPAYFVVLDFVSSYGWPLTFYSYTHHEDYSAQVRWSTVALGVNIMVCLVIVLAGGLICECMLRIREAKKQEREIQQALESAESSRHGSTDRGRGRVSDR